MHHVNSGLIFVGAFSTKLKGLKSALFFLEYFEERLLLLCKVAFKTQGKANVYPSWENPLAVKLALKERTRSTYIGLRYLC